MRRFELVAGKSAEFWQVEIDGSRIHLGWGQIGANEQSETKSFSSAEAAEAAAEKLIADKVGQGYMEVASPTPQASVELAPWEPVAEPEVKANRPRRGVHPNSVSDLPPTIQVTWDQVRENFVWLKPGGNRWDDAVDELTEAAVTLGDPQLSSDALTIAMFAVAAREGNPLFVDYVRDRYGMATLISALLEGLGQVSLIRPKRVDDRSRTVDDQAYKAIFFFTAWSWDLGDGLERLAAVLAQLPEQEYQQCLAQVRQAWLGLAPWRQLVVALLFPEEPDLAEDLARTQLATSQSETGLLHALIGVVRDPELLAAVLKAPSTYQLVWEDGDWCEDVLARFGVNAVERLAPGAKYQQAGKALGLIGHPDAVKALARVASSSKDALARLNEAVERWPAAAIAALAPLVAAGGKMAALLEPVLANLVVANPALADRVCSWLGGAAGARIGEVLDRLTEHDEADVDQLPPVLASPPWLGKRAKTTVPSNVVLEPLELPETEEWGPGGVEAFLKLYPYCVRRAATTTQDEAIDSFLGFEPGVEPEARAAFQRAQAAGQAGDAERFVSEFQQYTELNEQSNSRWGRSLWGADIVAMPPNVGLAVWNQLAPDLDRCYGVEIVAATLRLEGLPGTLALARRSPGSYAALLAPFGSVHCAPFMARCWARLKSVRQVGKTWLLTFPEHAVAGLMPDALGKRGEAKDCAISALLLLAAEGHADTIRQVASRWGRADVDAAVSKLLELDLLQLLPSKIPTLPKWWATATWHRPVLKSGKALPADAVDAIGVMLALPNAESYAGLEQVIEACFSESLARFSWDAFSAWLAAGADSKSGWAMTSLGLLGDDEVARRLTSLIRAWPGESQHKRAVNGLDVLAGIGSDVALMMLNGIAQKVKFKGLKDAARAKIDQIAAERGLSSEELADRLAPDLGLDERGTLRLDFGSRWFEVGFDESLQPFVRDEKRVRLKALPKPRQSDDPELAKDATKRFSQLKKDARTVAGQQVFRFELAMCDQRRWEPTVFRQLIVSHPLVRHVARRLVWGVYVPDAERPNFGGTLDAVFRVDEEGELTTATEEPFKVPEGTVIGVVHPLHLDVADSSAMGGLFADYEIVQPFAQLSRQTYALTEEEKQSTELTRWKDREFPTGRALGLTNRGWRRDEALDGGVEWFSRQLPCGETAYCNLDPGMGIGFADLTPEQSVASVTLAEKRDLATAPRFSVLDPVSASELIREMEILTDPEA